MRKELPEEALTKLGVDVSILKPWRDHPQDQRAREYRFEMENGLLPKDILVIFDSIQLPRNFSCKVKIALEDGCVHIASGGDTAEYDGKTAQNLRRAMELRIDSIKKGLIEAEGYYQTSEMPIKSLTMEEMLNIDTKIKDSFTLEIVSVSIRCFPEAWNFFANPEEFFI